MGYFPNGTSGECYRDAYCYGCANHRDKHDGRGAGCAIWDLHLLYNSEQHDTESDDPAKRATSIAWKAALSELIPETDEGTGECSLFLPSDPYKRAAQEARWKLASSPAGLDAEGRESE